MIGSHDSFTYLNATSKVYEKISALWRTQTKTIQNQYKAGVRYFDVRVRRDGDIWRVCHGLVDFNQIFTRLEMIPKFFNKIGEDCILRIILERGDDTLFKAEAEKLKENNNVTFIGIKDNWQVLYNEDPPIKDYSYIPWDSGKSIWGNITAMKYFSSIKKHAKKNNPQITPELIADETVHFMDLI